MKLENYEVHLPSYSIGDTIYDKIGPVCESYGRKVLVIGGAQSPGRRLRQDRRLRGADQLGDHRHGDLRRELHLCHRGAPAGYAPLPGGGHGLWRGRRQGPGHGEMPVHPRRQAGVHLPHHRLQLRGHHLGVHSCTTRTAPSLKPHFFVRPAMHAFIDTQILAQAPSQYHVGGHRRHLRQVLRGPDLLPGRAAGALHRPGGGGQPDVPRPPAAPTAHRLWRTTSRGLCTYAVEQVVLAIVVTTGIASIFLTKDYTPRLQQRPGPRRLLRPHRLPRHRGAPPARGGGGLWHPAGAAGGRPKGGV